MDENGKCALYTGCTIIISGLCDSRVSSDWPFGAILRLWLILTTLAVFLPLVLRIPRLHHLALLHPTKRGWSHSDRRRYRNSRFPALRLSSDRFFVYSANAIFSAWARNLRALKPRTKRIYIYIYLPSMIYIPDCENIFGAYVPFYLSRSTCNSICVYNCSFPNLRNVTNIQCILYLKNHNLSSSKSTFKQNNILNGKLLIIREEGGGGGGVWISFVL